ncbi:chitinase [Glaciimonas sp. PCH181]|uniref:chitinase n=1 Tax=Glaciimonas sp. PCH181 TaxID=2133943 RepID=UPI000D34B4F2|nr:chitinase [Glaciimonas sp. PCH181]PUA20220.1 hypothetical protein C7W93_10710 [Glaciimonas sp. PCH181]
MLNKTKIFIAVTAAYMAIVSPQAQAVNCTDKVEWTPSLIINSGEEVVYKNNLYTLSNVQNKLWNAAPDNAGHAFRYQDLGQCKVKLTEKQLALSELLAEEKRLSDDPRIQEYQAVARTITNEEVSLVAPLNPNNPDNVRRVESIVDQQMFDQLADPELRHEGYNYANFLKGVAKYPAFCGSYDDGRDAGAICSKTVATLFAHFAQDSGLKDANHAVPEARQSLNLLREKMRGEPALENVDYGMYVWGCAPGESPPAYTSDWSCGVMENGKFQNYFGRGSSQLAYYYNYAPFSLSVFGDAKVLLNNPAMVADTWLNFGSAIFSFVNMPNLSTPSIIQIIDGSWKPNAVDQAQGWIPGFGLTTNMLHGKFECGAKNVLPAQGKRAQFYAETAELLSVDIAAENLLCNEMTISNQHPGGGAASANVYWDTTWSDTPSCKLVHWEMPWTAIRDGSSGQYGNGDYARCVAHNYPDFEIVDDRKSTK